MKNNLSRHFEKLFNKTREISKIGLWHVDLINQTAYWDEQTKIIHEVAPDFVPDLATGINFYKEGYSRDEISRLSVILSKKVSLLRLNWKL